MEAMGRRRRCCARTRKNKKTKNKMCVSLAYVFAYYTSVRVCVCIYIYIHGCISQYHIVHYPFYFVRQDTESASKTTPLLFLLVLAPLPFSTIWTYPLPIWRRFQANAFVMEPFFNAQTVTATHHIAVRNTIAKAISWLKPLALVVVKLVYKI